MSWSTSDIPDQSGRVAIVTGASSGLGYETAAALAEHGATVLLATRDAQKTAAVAERIRGRAPAAELTHLPLDLADLDTVRAAVEQFLGRHERLDLLVNNAGVMATPPRTTAQGFELQFGVNHLGHFVLTNLLGPLLRTTSGARVVTVSSGLHRRGRIDFDDLMGGRDYQRWDAYAQSKLANLLFTLELQRRFSEAGDTAIAVAAHPGYAATNLQFHGASLEGGARALVTRALSVVANAVFAQSAAAGALPILYAATAPGVAGMSYWGPTRFSEQRGPVGPASRTDRALDAEIAQRLWSVSEGLTAPWLTTPGPER
jgi:NAD(P)-dependent dehydrogenase (short-subunit alcohol dehydrogenase family)